MMTGDMKLGCTQKLRWQSPQRTDSLVVFLLRASHLTFGSGRANTPSAVGPVNASSAFYYLP
jgi:hypothetical protein